MQLLLCQLLLSAAVQGFSPLLQDPHTPLMLLLYQQTRLHTPAHQQQHSRSSQNHHQQQQQQQQAASQWLLPAGPER
jgi:hypothetical protein